jgi:hypothetical protein
MSPRKKASNVDVSKEVPAPKVQSSKVPIPTCEFSQPWMVHWVIAAATSVTIEEACASTGVSLTEFQQGRLADFAFDEACRAYDHVIDLKITESLRHKAAQGNVPAQSLYFHRVRELVLKSDSEDPLSTALFAAAEAEALLRAGLEKLEELSVTHSYPVAAVVVENSLPSPTPSQPAASRSRKSLKRGSCGSEDAS